jgi:glycosyltransferase involved in cell wall biosynthesis
MARLVSVVVPAYNYGELLPQALESVLSQTYVNWECVIVDDGSTDDTRETAEQWCQRDRRFRYLFQENRGPSAARNLGIRNSSGDFLQFLDADDRLMPEKLELHVRYLDNHPESDIVYGPAAFFRSETPDSLMVSLEGRLTRPLMARVHGAAEAFEKLQHHNIMPLPAALTRRLVIDRAGLFDEKPRAMEDHGFWLRCAASGCRFDYLEAPSPLVAIRSHPNSASRHSRRMLVGLIESAEAFAAWPPASRMSTPLIYEVASGFSLIERKQRVDGSRRIWRAARSATESLTAIRWYGYALAALLLPRSTFLSLASKPIPERLFQFMRQMRGSA